MYIHMYVCTYTNTCDIFIHTHCILPRSSLCCFAGTQECIIIICMRTTYKLLPNYKTVLKWCTLWINKKGHWHLFKTLYKYSKRDLAFHNVCFKETIHVIRESMRHISTILVLYYTHYVMNMSWNANKGWTLKSGS